MDKRQKNQVLLALASEGRGEAPDSARQGTESIPAKSHPESPVETRLIEEVVNRENLFKALKRVKDKESRNNNLNNKTIRHLIEI